MWVNKDKTYRDYKDKTFSQKWDCLLIDCKRL